MGKKKKKNKGSRNKSLPDANLTVKQLLVKGSQVLNQGNARDAITLFKQVEKKTGRNEEIDLNLFRSYALRQKQLVNKGLITESEAIKKYVCEYFPGVEKIDEEQMKDYLNCCSSEGAFSAYRHYISRVKISPVLERSLADLLVQERCWKYLENFDLSVPLKRDSKFIKKAIPMMEKAQWEDALESLTPIARTSPFAPLRMFCRAMVAFYQEDDSAFERAASMVPEDFFLKPLLDTLVVSVSKTASKSDKNKVLPILGCLYEGPVNGENLAKELLFELKHKRPASCAEKIDKLAKLIYPEDHDTAVIEIINILWKSLMDDFMNKNNFEKLLIKLLSKNKAEMIINKFEYLMNQESLSHAGTYLTYLPMEFSDQKEKDIGHSLVLRNTVSFALNKNGGQEKDLFENKEFWIYYKDALGVQGDNDDLIPVEILRKSIGLDPESREGYELLSRFSLTSRDEKNAAEDIFVSMMNRFPDDPYPCLELANLYYSKNAFRKAEKVLQDAMKRAPHDNRVLDRCALSLIISAEKNMCGGRYHLSGPDLEKAFEQGRKKHAVLLAAKRAIHRYLAENGTIENAIINETRDFSLVEYLRTLAIILSDLEAGKIDIDTAIISEVNKIIKKTLKKTSHLFPKELLLLMSPLDKQYHVVTPEICLANFFLKHNPKIFRGLSNGDFLSIIDKILEPSLFLATIEELKRRVNKPADPQSLICEFYLAVIEHMTGHFVHVDTFENILDRASEKERKMLEEASRRLSFHASGTLRTALEKFDFELLNPFFPRFDMGPSMEELLERLKDEDPKALIELINNFKDTLDPDMAGSMEFFDDEEDEIWETMEEIENMIDESGMRDVPEFMIRIFRNQIRSSRKDRNRFDDMASFLKPVAEELTKEAQIFLYGRAWA